MASTASSEAPSRSQRDSIARAFDIDDLRLERSGRAWVIEGRAPCYDAKKRAALAVSRMVGRAAVVNRLRVVPQGGRDDAALAESVRAALAEHGVPAGVIVSTKDGIVALSGKVASHADRCTAELAAWSVRGVANVVSHLRGSPSVEAPATRRTRRDALQERGKGTQQAHGHGTTGGFPTAGL